MKFIICLFAAVASASAASRTCHGDIKNLNPTGKKKGGVAASHADVKHDFSYLEKNKDCYQASADANCIQASLIAAIASRESRGGSLLEKTGGYGDGKKAWGIMQCDLSKSGLPCKDCKWNSCCHIEMMTSKVLVPFIKEVKAKRKWTTDRSLQGGVAAYNFGVRNVQTWDGLDEGTPGDDYSNDIIARAQWLEKEKKWN